MVNMSETTPESRSASITDGGKPHKRKLTNIEIFNLKRQAKKVGLEKPARVFASSFKKGSKMDGYKSSLSRTTLVAFKDEDDDNEDALWTFAEGQHPNRRKTSHQYTDVPMEQTSLEPGLQTGFTGTSRNRTNRSFRSISPDANLLYNNDSWDENARPLKKQRRNNGVSTSLGSTSPLSELSLPDVDGDEMEHRMSPDDEENALRIKRRKRDTGLNGGYWSQVTDIPSRRARTTIPIVDPTLNLKTLKKLKIPKPDLKIKIPNPYTKAYKTKVASKVLKKTEHTPSFIHRKNSNIDDIPTTPAKRALIRIRSPSPYSQKLSQKVAKINKGDYRPGITYTPRISPAHPNRPNIFRYNTELGKQNETPHLCSWSLPDTIPNILNFEEGQANYEHKKRARKEIALLQIRFALDILRFRRHYGDNAVNWYRHVEKSLKYGENQEVEAAAHWVVGHHLKNLPGLLKFESIGHFKWVIMLRKTAEGIFSMNQRYLIDDACVKKILVDDAQELAELEFEKGIQEKEDMAADETDEEAVLVKKKPQLFKVKTENGLETKFEVGINESSVVSSCSLEIQMRTKTKTSSGS